MGRKRAPLILKEQRRPSTPPHKLSNQAHARTSNVDRSLGVTAMMLVIGRSMGASAPAQRQGGDASCLDCRDGTMIFFLLLAAPDASLVDGSTRSHSRRRPPCLCCCLKRGGGWVRSNVVRGRLCCVVRCCLSHPIPNILHTHDGPLRDDVAGLSDDASGPCQGCSSSSVTEGVCSYGPHTARAPVPSHPSATHNAKQRTAGWGHRWINRSQNGSTPTG